MDKQQTALLEFAEKLLAALAIGGYLDSLKKLLGFARDLLAFRVQEGTLLRGYNSTNKQRLDVDRAIASSPFKAL